MLTSVAMKDAFVFMFPHSLAYKFPHSVFYFSSITYMFYYKLPQILCICTTCWLNNLDLTEIPSKCLRIVPVNFLNKIERACKTFHALTDKAFYLYNSTKMYCF